MINKYYIRNNTLIDCIENLNNWEQVFIYYLNKCNNFIIYYPGNINEIIPFKHNYEEFPMIVGKKEFLELDNTFVSKYYGMKDSIKIRGVLNHMSRNLFLEFMDNSFEGYSSYLWQFELKYKNKTLLKISDFSDCFLFINKTIFQDLKNLI